MRDKKEYTPELKFLGEVRLDKSRSLQRDDAGHYSIVNHYNGDRLFLGDPAELKIILRAAIKGTEKVERWIKKN